MPTWHRESLPTCPDSVRGLDTWRAIREYYNVTRARSRYSWSQAVRDTGPLRQCVEHANYYTSRHLAYKTTFL